MCDMPRIMDRFTYSIDVGIRDNVQVWAKLGHLNI